MRKVSTEYEITTVDESGDIIDIEFFETKAKALSAFEKMDCPSELWKVTHVAYVSEDGEPISTDRSEILISSKL